MCYLGGAVFLIILIFIAYPYVRIYQIENAVIDNNMEMLAMYVDLDEIRQTHKQQINKEADSTANMLGENVVADLLRKGVSVLGNAAVDEVVDEAWVSKQLLEKSQGAMTENLSFAFFESPTRFNIRFRELNNNPSFVELTLQDWNWRITAFYQ